MKIDAAFQCRELLQRRFGMGHAFSRQSQRDDGSKNVVKPFGDIRMHINVHRSVFVDPKTNTVAIQADPVSESNMTNHILNHFFRVIDRFNCFAPEIRTDHPQLRKWHEAGFFKLNLQFYPFVFHAFTYAGGDHASREAKCFIGFVLTA
ncbi:Uncharacterised protein [Salmonella enterica subsp. enterica serovar Typhi]|nr:Uncharacterised protein [Salmonella enterica subsp. enterica serovar Typhi]CQW02649.1 Uncharacterised protein [Salmonella enterica subsp. enterica serovar Typhi]CWZ18379.1 Uncharacterised protein [Salmonella enterica subsp. enterica serovar Typhi]CWZ23131.1 Uncharacterised protein [Salmonella enterica subsp. enterica serovar Typhi]